METKTDYSKKVYVIKFGKIEEMTYYDYCHNYGCQENISEDIITCQLHVRQMNDRFSIWEWDESGSSRRQMDTSFDTRGEANEWILEAWEESALKWMPVYDNQSEAEEALIENKK